MEDTTEGLASFGPEFQKGILGYCMKEVSFLISCRALIRPEWFSGLAYMDLAKIIFAIYDFKKSKSGNERLPTVVEVTTAIMQMFPKLSDANPRLEALNLAVASANASHVDLDWMQKQMTGWIRMLKLKNLIEEAGLRFKKKEFGSCTEWVDKKIEDVKQASFMNDERESFADPVGFLNSFQEEIKTESCTFGNVDIDEVLRTGAKLNFSSKDVEEENVKALTRGSLMPGDLTVLIGATNTGKTTTVVTITAANVLMGKYVCLFSHEMLAKQMKLRILTCMMKTTEQDLFQRGPVDPTYKERLAKCSALLEKYLHYQHYAKPGGMFVEDVISEIEKASEKLAARRLVEEKVAKGFDLIIDDYPAKLKSKFMAGSQGWEEKTYVYNEFLNLAQAQKAHVVAPAQSNRQGVRISRGDTSDGRMLEVDDIGEAFGITTIAANVITVNRSASDIAQGLLRFYVSKSRSPAKGITVVCPANFKVGRTFDLNCKVKILQPGQAFTPSDAMSYFGIRNAERDIITEAPQLQSDKALAQPVLEAMAAIASKPPLEWDQIGPSNLAAYHEDPPEDPDPVLS